MEQPESGPPHTYNAERWLLLAAARFREGRSFKMRMLWQILSKTSLQGEASHTLETDAQSNSEGTRLERMD